LAVQGLARGERQYLELLAEDSASSSRAILVAEYVGQRGESAADLAAGWARRLKRQTTFSIGVEIDEAEISAFVAKFRVRKKAPEGGSIATLLIDSLETVWDRVSASYDGLLLYADELDQFADGEAVASFLKVLTEQLAIRGLRNVGLLIVGQEDLLPTLLAGHASVGRVFQQIHLPPFEDDDVRDLLENALVGTGVNIDADAERTVIGFAEGYPAAVHLLGYEAFDVAIESRATVIDTGVIERSVARLAGRGEYPARD
jgi:hypothetical protein